MTAKSAGEAGENPLVPNAKLRQMYTRMLDARALDEAVTKRLTARGSRRVPTARGQEAVRVSTTIELGDHDLVSDTVPTAGMGLLLGGERSSLLRGFTNPKARRERLMADAGAGRMLPWIAEEEQRLHLAVGAALALKTQRRQGIVVAYALKGELGAAAWRRVLEPAAKLDAPILFVALQRPGAVKKGAELNEICKTARAAKVPGIPVDTCDAVALYRVTQESLGRTRAGDGPALIESVNWRLKKSRTRIDDPIEHLKHFLLERKICDAAWFRRSGKNGSRSLAKQQSASKNR
jgi:TPP-dependent pyruvate/acetoin dehydrogenase alpha subunit